MSGPHPAGHPSALLRRVAQLLGSQIIRVTIRMLYRVQVRWDGPLPSGPVLFAANHRSFWDPPLVGMCMRDPLSYFARASLWKVAPIRWLLDIMHGIPVERENPGLSSMKGAVANLRRGISVLIFPEGTRTRTGRLQHLRDGPALFARRAGVPIVPVYLANSDRAWPRGALLPRLGEARIKVRFGLPIVVPALPPREADAWVSNRLRAWMQAAESRTLRGRRPGRTNQR